jgi:hypothetical protein
MLTKRFHYVLILAVAIMMGTTSVVAAGDRHPLSLEPTTADANALTARLVRQDDRPASETTTVTTQESLAGYDDLGGPYFLRSADPLKPGEIELKFKYEFSRATSSEEHEIELVFEWGIAPDWEFIFEVPVELGEGKVEGNGDIGAFGFHTRLWEESDWMPAFAVRNLIRIPTGYRSDGVDYTLRGLFTKTLVPDVLRAHFNPFLTSINGNREDEERWFRWGAALGVDYMVNEDLRFVADYFIRNSEEFGQRNQHTIELGLDWEFVERQYLSIASDIEIDGDKYGDNFSVAVQYMIEIDAPRLR